ncbi:MAG: LicD family protein [Nocardioidaceae bacterium]
MRQCAELLRVLQDDARVPSFICYGTLLGAARNGRIIGHDNDVDLAYLSRQADPVDVMRKSSRIERLLTDKGWVVRRGMGTRLNVRLPSADGSLRFVDVFTAHWVDGVLYMPSDTGFAASTRRRCFR